MYLKKLALLLFIGLLFNACTNDKIHLSHGVDESAGGGSTYIISTPTATYYLEKEGGGLSSMIDADGVDWIGFHNEKGSGHKGEYRGFPNAIHRQDGNYFHALNAGTDSSNSIVELNTEKHIRITFTSNNKQWEGQWDFYPDRCDFTMTKISPSYKYWVQYEGVPGGEMDTTDFWYASIDNKKHPITEPFSGDLPSPEWMAFGDENSSFMIYLLHHQDDHHPDNYVQRPDMTVLGFGRQNLEETTKHLTTVQTFSIGFLQSTTYSTIDKAMKGLLE
ncbi:hypothetical protein [Maribacter hydrothermalis]|uniref:Uncharacterized protein n=1 Tax=Maribacter hydrothermalis TaxID=1836467 RepID=A0A1B7YY42_9FLAO|nr:hypothetical protein [Maribacter hydrothermalis]APQ16783.1 hypothetical protein BTR34_05375 [Maribacter hydrothermalis]OBR35210.1 hypothetical protein A9200_11605 [Maribacter hydrothermalis]